MSSVVSQRDEPSPPDIKTATRAEDEPVMSVLTLAFSVDPLVRWAISDLRRYLAKFPEGARIYGGKALDHGTAHCVSEYQGVALWLPPNVHLDEEAMLGWIEETVPKARQPEFLDVLDRMSHFHPTEPHWFLPLIGVDPVHQGKGLGSALLKHALVQCDRENRLAYLDSSNPRNVPLYQRHGFEVLGTIQLGTSPPVFPMLRRPR